MVRIRTEDSAGRIAVLIQVDIERWYVFKKIRDRPLRLEIAINVHTAKLVYGGNTSDIRRNSWARRFGNQLAQLWVMLAYQILIPH